MGLNWRGNKRLLPVFGCSIDGTDSEKGSLARACLVYLIRKYEITLVAPAGPRNCWKNEKESEQIFLVYLFNHVTNHCILQLPMSSPAIRRLLKDLADLDCSCSTVGRWFIYLACLMSICIQSPSSYQPTLFYHQQFMNTSGINKIVYPRRNVSYLLWDVVTLIVQ